MLKRLVLVGVLLIPIATYAFIKPVRVVVPEIVGLSCNKAQICIDDESRYQEATALYDEALSFVDSTVGLIENRPKVVFCSTDACFQSFGLGKRAAATIGTFGIVVSPRAWKSFYVRHEMIHHLQYEQLGIVRMLGEPQWFVEGMGYALSEDPRTPLSEPFESYRTQFKEWYQQVGKTQLWEKAPEFMYLKEIDNGIF